MTDSQNITEFIKKFPEEFNELVNIFKNLKFDDDSENSEEKQLTEAINELKEKYGLNDFVQNLLKMDLKKLLALIKEKVKEIKAEKEKENIKTVEKKSLMFGLGCLACIKESVSKVVNQEFYNMRLEKKQQLSR